jgi:hypothetical protein
MQPTPATRLPHRAKYALFMLAPLIALGVAGLWLSSYPQREEQDLGNPAKRSTVTETRTAASVLPTARQIRDARALAERRLGVVSFAVTDTSGQLRCYRCRTKYVAASVVKAMLLVAYLDRLAEKNRALTPDHHAQLDAMISVSDNASATGIYAHVGQAGLRRLAQRARMRDFEVSDGWATAKITAADQARFFRSIDKLVPAEYRAYVSRVLASIVSSQAWGVPEISRPEWITLFKGGWRRTGRGELVHQVARLKRADAVITIAILTDGNPRPAYGRATIRGIARHLLAPP